MFAMVEGVPTVERWWNGRWGKLARRDVVLRQRGAWFVVEAWQGGPDSTPRTWTFPNEDQASAWLRRCLDDGLGGWQRVDA